MKLNKGKGKVHPSPSSSSSSSSSSSFSLSSSSASDPISSLNLLLPAAILTLISVLSLEDREVLAYLITHSLKSSTLNPNPSPGPILDHAKKPKKSRLTHLHKSTTSFDCDCFDCYTTYWFRWDSSPNRELIHQAIEAFEDHLAKSEQPKKSGKSRRKEKLKVHKSPIQDEKPVIEEPPPEEGPPSGNGESPPEEREREEEVKVNGGGHGKPQQHKGLARKMLPDVIGFFNSRLWNLWGHNV